MKLSIITINYNDAKGLENTVKSILPILGADVEYIVIDGNSSDSSKEVVAKYADSIDYWISEPDSGIYNAMNKGIAQAKGEYLLFMNSGDMFKSDANIDKVLQYLESKEDIIFFNIEERNEAESKTTVRKYSEEVDFLFFIDGALPHQASFIKKELFSKYGYYDENLKIASDWTFFIDRICLNSCTCKHVDDTFSVFMTDGISCNPEYQALSLGERQAHLDENYSVFMSMYDGWKEQKEVLHKLRMSKSIQMVKKFGLLKWFQIYND